MRCRTVNMIERHIKGGQKTIAYKQLGLSMDIETKVVQHVSSPKESDLTTLHTYSIFENIVFLVISKTCNKLHTSCSLQWLLVHEWRHGLSRIGSNYFTHPSYYDDHKLLLVPLPWLIARTFSTEIKQKQTESFHKKTTRAGRDLRHGFVTG